MFGDKKILHLVLTKKWFDMILFRDKHEEYRDLTPYWEKRLCNIDNNVKDWDLVDFKKFDIICFTNGYSKKSRRMYLVCKGIHVGEGFNDLGAIEGKQYFIIELGAIIEVKNGLN